MSLGRPPDPPWRGLAASLILHAGLLGGFGPWSASSGDETAPVATVELVSPPEAAALPKSPAPKSPALASPPPSRSAPVQPARPTRTPRPTPSPLSAPAQSPAESAAAGGATGTDATGEGAAAAAAATGDAVVRPRDAEAVPMAGNPPPPYPFGARRAGREGRTVLLVTLSPAGECLEVSIAESSGTPALDQSARATVSGWRFHPAIRDGQAVAVRLRVPILFSLTSG